MGCGSSSSAVVVNHPASPDVSSERNMLNSSNEQQHSHQGAELSPWPEPSTENSSGEPSQGPPCPVEQHSNDTLKNIPLTSSFIGTSSIEFERSCAEGERSTDHDNVGTVDGNKDITEIKHDCQLSASAMALSPDEKVYAQTKESDMSVKKFYKYLKQSCRLTHNERLLETASFVTTLKLDRSFYTFTKSDLLCKAVSMMKFLHTLKLSGGQMGAIAFRFLVTSLRHNTSIKNLDVSDNMANPECSAAIGSFLAINSTLEVLNLSGNRLGKDSLSRHVGSAILKNGCLKYLDISNCGATDLHCLCESVKSSTCSCLVTLKAADNTISDDHQFAVDLSLILESDTCKLEDVDVSNTSMSSSAMDILIESISKNNSICTLCIGKNAISSTKMLCMILINVLTHSNMTEFSMGKTKVDDPTLCDFTECKISQERDVLTSNLQRLDISDCSIDSSMLQYLASEFGGKLPNLVSLDISKNDIGREGLYAFDQLTKGHLKELNMMHVQKSNGIIEAITSKFSNLSWLDFTRTKLSQDDIKKLLDHVFQHATSLSLNGLKLSGLGIFSGLCDMQTSLHITELQLSVCQLIDIDMNPLCDILGQSMQSFPLKKLDVSVNRLTSAFIQRLTESLLKHPRHDLQSINASNNAMDGSCLNSLSKLFTTATHCSSVNSVNLSHNAITADSVIYFLSTVLDQRFPLQNCDLSNQNDKFVESDMEELAKLLKEILQKPQNMWSDCDFVIDLRDNGGSEILNLCSVDSAAIKTDFARKRKPELTLRDVIEVMKGINLQNNGMDMLHRYSISAELWKEVVLKDAPAWVLVNSELLKASYLSNLPSTATNQKIQGMLEMDADCDIKDLFIVKDPMTQQSTGIAWVLFQDTQSLNQAVDWFYDGNAYIFGSQFNISEIPLCITNESNNAIDAANRDLKIRSIEAKQQLEIDKKVLEESTQLAAERAEYRELHPAYQGGRIS